MEPGFGGGAREPQEKGITQSPDGSQGKDRFSGCLPCGTGVLLKPWMLKGDLGGNAQVRDSTLVGRGLCDRPV